MLSLGCRRFGCGATNSKSANAYLPMLSRLLIGGSGLFRLRDRRPAKAAFNVMHAWGMTEMSSIGTTSRSVLRARRRARRAAARRAAQARTLHAAGRVEAARRRWQRRSARRKTAGALWVRGPAVTGSYYRVDEALPVFKDGWFHTGDVCTMDEYGYLQLVDRSKDLVKSGGEWISSVDLENTIMGHPAIKEAAVIGLPHPKWVERPVAVAVLREGKNVDEASLQAWIGERVVKWMIPDRVIFVDAIPRTGVGKFLKRDLRDQYKDLLGGA